MTQNDEGNMLAPMWLFDHVAACIRDGKATEEMAQNVECLRGGMEAQAARIAELEAKLQAVLRREEDANRAAFAHMRRITALEANGIAARKATAKNYARAEAAEKALAAAEARSAALVAGAYEAAAQTVDTSGDSAVTEALGQRLCCSGQDCGCRGADVGAFLLHLIRDLTPADATAALARLIAEAKAEGMREAAGIADSLKNGLTHYGPEPYRICATAILAAAAAKEPKP